MEIVVTRVVLGQFKRSRASDRLVQSNLLLVAVLAWVLDRSHVLHLASGLRGDLAEARDQIVVLKELKVGPGNGVRGNVANRVVGHGTLTVELVCLEEGLLKIGRVLIATCLHSDHILVTIEVISVLVFVLIEKQTATCTPSLLMLRLTSAEKETAVVLALLRSEADLLAVSAIEDEAIAVADALHALRTMVNHLRQAAGGAAWEECLALHLHSVVLTQLPLRRFQAVRQVLERGGRLVSPLPSNQLVESLGDRSWISYWHR